MTKQDDEAEKFNEELLEAMDEARAHVQSTERKAWYNRFGRWWKKTFSRKTKK